MSAKLTGEIRACTVCKNSLPFAPRPVFQFSSQSKIVIVGQAPGIRVHESGIPWNDPSGRRLREWMNVSDDTFYDTHQFSIVPMAFCYPGTGKSGDLPPRPECAPLWMQRILDTIKKKRLLILIGQYAQNYFLGHAVGKNLTETVKHWQNYTPDYFVLPHPSPRNNIWLKRNPWFEDSVIPALRKTVHEIQNYRAGEIPTKID